MSKEIEEMVQKSRESAVFPNFKGINIGKSRRSRKEPDYNREIKGIHKKFNNTMEKRKERKVKEIRKIKTEKSSNLIRNH